MDETTRARITEYVRPLAVGLDGVTNYGDVERVAAAADLIARGRPDVDADRLFLLAVFSGQEKWVSRMGHRSRTELFLASLGVARRDVSALFRSLERLDTDPRTPEEEIVHDAVRLDRLGAYGIARSLVEGYRERQDFVEMAAAIEEEAGVGLRTPAAEALAAPRRETMRDFAKKLRQEYGEFA
ncbi:MAG: hypothetical protein ABI592_01070 [Acidobacteriota bacterium]